MSVSYPRQFVFTAVGHASSLPWPTVSTPHYSVHHHAALPVTQLRSHDRTLTLLGYAIDPAHPALTDTQILQHLLDHTATTDQLLSLAAQLGGRWALLIETPQQHLLFHDACGLRQVFYSDASLSTPFCASQASTAAKLFDLAPDPAAENDFLATTFARTDAEYWWPGDSTRFRGVRCLLPNHYLDLRTRQAHRYAPSNLLPPAKPQPAAAAAGKLLHNLIDGISRRFELSLPLTAGWDSRVIFAACRSAKVTPYVYTLRFSRMKDAHQDLVIPQKMLSSFNWEHHVLPCPATASPEFSADYKANLEPAHDEACAIAEGLQRGYPPGRVSLSGHCSEVARCYYHLTPHTGSINAKDLADLTHMDPTPFVLQQYENWLQGAIPAAKQSSIALLDLFYWEQRAGRWAANGQSQWDLVHERFAPFNCRPLLLTLLATNPRFRRPLQYSLYADLVRTLSPNLLNFPINPDTTPKPRHRNPFRALAHRVFHKLRRTN